MGATSAGELDEYRWVAGSKQTIFLRLFKNGDAVKVVGPNICGLYAVLVTLETLELMLRQSIHLSHIEGSFPAAIEVQNCGPDRFLLISYGINYTPRRAIQSPYDQCIHLYTAR